MGLVLLPLFDRHLVPYQILLVGETLNPLREQVPVRHRVPHDAHLETGAAKQLGDGTARLRLADPRPRRANGDDRKPGAQHRATRPGKLEVGSRGIHTARQVHDVLVGHVRIGHDAALDVELRDQGFELVLRMNRDAPRVELRARDRRRIPAVFDMRNLLGREADDFDGRITPIKGVEDVEVTSCRPENQRARAVHACPAESAPRRAA